MNIVIGIVIIVLGIVIAVLGWECIIIVSTPFFRQLGMIIVIFGIIIIVKDPLNAFVEQFGSNRLLGMGIIALILSIIIILSFIFLISYDGIIDKIIEVKKNDIGKIISFF